MNGALDLATRLLGPAARRRVMTAAQLDDVPRRILDDAFALDDIAVAQAHFAAGLQAVKLARRVLHEVVTLDEDLAREGHFARSELGPVRMVRGLEPLLFVLRIGLDDDFQRIEHGETARRHVVQVLANAAFELAELRDLLLLRRANPAHELDDGLGRVAAPSDAGQRRHTRIVPTFDVLVVDELLQLALARDREHEVRARELDLSRSARFALPQLVQEPVI